MFPELDCEVGGKGEVAEEVWKARAKPSGTLVTMIHL